MKAKGQVWILFDRESQRKTKPMSLVDAQMMVLSMKGKHTKRFYIWTPGWVQWQKLDDFLKKDQTFFAVAPSRISRGSKKNTPSSENTQSGSETDATIIISDNKSALTKIHDESSLNSDSYQTHVSHTDGDNPTQVEIDYQVFDFHGDHLKMKTKSSKKKANIPSQPSEKRRDSRFDYNFEVILVSKNGKSFRSYSLNISMGGAFLENPIPRDFLGAHFDLIIVNKFETNPKKNRLLFKGKVVGDVVDPRRLTFVDPAKETAERLQSILQMFPSINESSLKKTGTR